MYKKCKSDTDSSDADDVYNCDKIRKYNRQLDILTKKFDTILRECKESIHITRRNMDNIQTLSKRFERKIKRIRTYRSMYINLSGKYDSKIQKKLEDMSDIINELESVQRSIGRRQDQAKQSATNYFN